MIHTTRVLGVFFFLVMVFALISGGCWDDKITQATGSLCPPKGATMAEDATNYHKDIGRCLQNHTCEPVDGLENVFQCKVKEFLVQCAKGEVACGPVCIDPLTSTTHCGAKGDCYADDEMDPSFRGHQCYKGALCEQGICQCRKGEILCDNECIDPRTSDSFCGASALCAGEDVGVLCEGGRKCVEGLCRCAAGEVFCQMGEEKPQCVDSFSNADFCGAKGLCNANDKLSDDYKGQRCNSNEECINGECIVRYCNDAEGLCPIMDEEGKFWGQNACFDLASDTEHCGSCYSRCNENKFVGATLRTPGCERGLCQYTCKEDYVQCNLKAHNAWLQPICIAKEQMAWDPENCGECGLQCGEDQFCQDGKCALGKCNNNACLLVNCEDRVDRCGSKCVNCKTFSETAKCEEGECIINACADNHHREMDTAKDHIVCVPNTSAACAPPNNDVGKFENCQLTPHAVLTECVRGRCVIHICQEGYYVGANRHTCINCCDTENIARWTCGIENQCIVEECDEGYEFVEKEGENVGCE